MKEVVEGQVNIEDLLNPSVGGAVRVKAAGMIRDIPVVPFMAEKSYPLIEYLDGVREQRTGSTRYNQGMDADSLNKTATGISIIQNASTQRAELVARQYAEFLRRYSRSCSSWSRRIRTRPKSSACAVNGSRSTRASGRTALICRSPWVSARATRTRLSPPHQPAPDRRADCRASGG
jgi:hypothetical protein